MLLRSFTRPDLNRNRPLDKAKTRKLSEFTAGVWDVATTGAPALGGINFWADGPAGAGGTYFVDDFNLQVVPEPAVTGLLALGSLVLLRSRRRKA